MECRDGVPRRDNFHRLSPARPNKQENDRLATETTMEGIQSRYSPSARDGSGLVELLDFKENFRSYRAGESSCGTSGRFIANAVVKNDAEIYVAI